jgi:triphosphoribosyl-dephospho-CoA synthase
MIAVSGEDVESAPDIIAAQAAAALIDEAMLAPKPGLVDPRDCSAHNDMTLATLTASVAALRPTFAELAEVAEGRPPDLRLRAEVGALGRRGEQQMLKATGGVNTHRGALWAIGLLVCGAANAAGVDEILDYGARLARLPDLGLPVDLARSHGDRACRRYRVGGARGEAHAGFPHVRTGVRILRRARDAGRSDADARLGALIDLIARLDDTCLLHRGGAAGLAIIQRGARRVLTEGGPGTASGRKALQDLDRIARRTQLSPGGSGDLLAAAIFVDEVTRCDVPEKMLTAVTEEA